MLISPGVVLLLVFAYAVSSRSFSELNPKQFWSLELVGNESTPLVTALDAQLTFDSSSPGLSKRKSPDVARFPNPRHHFLGKGSRWLRQSLSKDVNDLQLAEKSINFSEAFGAKNIFLSNDVIVFARLVRTP